MSQRFLDWMAQRASSDMMRTEMFMAAFGVVLVYAAIGLWPRVIRGYGKALFIITGVLAYVIAFAFAFFTLGIFLGFHW